MKQKKDQPAEGLPVFLDMMFDFAAMFIILVPMAVAAVSYLGGASFVVLVVHTITALVVVGLLLVIFSGIVASGALEAARSDAGAQQSDPSAAAPADGAAQPARSASQ